jgi:Holliday junction resolvasome RuvABC endonuclease subunit
MTALDGSTLRQTPTLQRHERPSYVWGVDCAVTHVSFAFAQHPTGPIHVDSLLADSEFREGERLGLLDRQIRIRCSQLRVTYPPSVVWVEQPSGRFPNPQLYYATGVIQAALYESLGCPVWTIPSGKWKAASVGKGTASKAEVMRWATLHRGGEFASQDDADAYCIAVGGRRILQTGLWDAEAAA